MDVMTNIKMVGKLINDNAPTLLTTVAVGGVVSTAVLAGKATAGAIATLYENELNEGRIASNREKLEMTWKHYVPPVLMGGATIACIIGANSISSRRTAALMSAYTLTERALVEYQDKIHEVMGEKKANDIQDKIAGDRIKNQPVESSEVIITGAGEQLCYDSLSGRYFKSDIEAIRKAQNDLNQRVLQDMYASHNDFYDLLGLENTGYGEEVGWTINHKMELSFSAHMSSEGKPCLSVDYHTTPIRDFHRFG